MRTCTTLSLTVLICSLFILSTTVSAKPDFHNLGTFFGGDSTCLDTFFLKKRGATSFSFKVYPSCDSLQWRYVQVDSLTPDSLIADSLWNDGMVVDTCCFAIDGLDPSTTYQVQLRGWCPDSMAYSAWSTPVFDTTRCEGPSDDQLSISDLTSSSVTLQTAVESDAYEWSLRRTVSWTTQQIVTGEDHIMWVNLPSNTEFEWKVRIKCADGTWSDYSNPQIFITEEFNENDCDTLKDHHISYNSLTSHSVNLHCHMHGNKYTWAMRKYGTSDWQTKSTSHGFYQWKDLKHGTKYEYKVKVECEDGYWTDWTGVKYFITKEAHDCKTPSSYHLSVKNLTHESAELHCSLSGVKYHWAVRKHGEYGWHDHTTSYGKYHWKNLKPNTKYQYKVKMKCHDGYWTSWSKTYYFTTKHYGGHCETPKGHHVYAKNIHYNEASTYCDVKGVKYHWAIRKHGTYSWKDYTTSNSYVHWKQLHSGQKYEYKVKVQCNSYDWTGWSSVHHFTTKDHYGYSCTTPTSHHLSVKNITYHSAATHCSVEGAEYHWMMRPYGSSGWKDKTTSAGHYEWHDLHYNTKYEYKVKVKCHNGKWTSWSKSHYFTTDDHYGSMCSTPQHHHMSVDNITYDGATTHCGVHGASYKWAIKPYGSYNWTHKTSTKGHYKWSGLKHKTKYVYKVKVDCGNGVWTGWSSSYTFTTKDHYGGSCSTPKSHHLSVSNLGYDKATTHCSVSGNKYHWAMRPKGSYSWTHKTSSSGSYHWKNLKTNAKYEYKVKVECSSGYWTGWSSVHYFTTHGHQNSHCTTPESYHVSVDNLSYHGATTKCHVSGVKYHWAIKRYGSYDWQHQTSTNGHYDWNNLYSNTTYAYKVKVQCSDVYWTDWSDVYYFTTHRSGSYDSYCNTPNHTQYYAVQETYNLFRVYCHAPFSKFTCAIKRASANDWSQHTTSVNNMGWGNLQPNTQYQYKVKIDCQGGGTSNWSAIKTFWTGSSSSATSGRTAGGAGVQVVIDEFNDLQHQPADLEIYPSPAHSQFSVSGFEGSAEVQIVDMQGRVVMTGSQVHHRDEINIEALENGLYNVLIQQSNGEQVTKKLVVVR